VRVLPQQIIRERFNIRTYLVNLRIQGCLLVRRIIKLNKLVDLVQSARNSLLTDHLRYDSLRLVRSDA